MRSFSCSGVIESLNLASKMCLITGAMAYLGAQGLRNVKKRLNLDRQTQTDREGESEEAANVFEKELCAWVFWEANEERGRERGHVESVMVRLVGNLYFFKASYVDLHH